MAHEESMTVHLEEILDSPGKSIPFVWDGPFEGEGVTLRGSLVTDFTLTNAGTRVILRGAMTADMKMTCARCIEPFFTKTHIDVFESFVPEDSPEATEKDEMDLTDLNIFTYEDRILDLHEVIRQNLVASVPLKPLCAESCGGLCPVCGQNRNAAPCACRQDTTDPRLAALVQLQAKAQSA